MQIFYPICDLSSSFSQKCSFSAPDHQIPIAHADLPGVSVVELFPCQSSACRQPSTPVIPAVRYDGASKQAEMLTEVLERYYGKTKSSFSRYCWVRLLTQESLLWILTALEQHSLCWPHHVLQASPSPLSSLWISLQISESTSLFPGFASKVGGHINNLLITSRRLEAMIVCITK